MDKISLKDDTKCIISNYHMSNKPPYKACNLCIDFLGNNTLVEDTGKQTEKFRPWKKPIIDGKPVPQKLPGVLTPWKNDNSITSDSGPCPSLRENEYKARFLDEPDCMSSDKENLPPTDSVTPPSLKNLSLEEEANDNENEATSWEASVARASSPFLK